MREESLVVSLIYFHVFLPNKVSVCSKNEKARIPFITRSSFALEFV